MELKFKIGDQVSFVNDGRKQNGKITHIEDNEKLFPYRVINEHGVSSRYSESDLTLIEEQKIKRGRPKKDKSKLIKTVEKIIDTEIDKSEEIVIDDLIDRNQSSFVDKYRNFISDLDLQQFLELHRLINIDYNIIQGMVTDQIGLRNMG